jgi:hypothetical protein
MRAVATGATLFRPIGRVPCAVPGKNATNGKERVCGDQCENAVPNLPGRTIGRASCGLDAPGMSTNRKDGLIVKLNDDLMSHKKSAASAGPP